MRVRRSTHVLPVRLLRDRLQHQRLIRDDDAARRVQRPIVVVPFDLLDRRIGFDAALEVHIGAFGEILRIQIRSQRKRDDGRIWERKLLCN